MILLFKYALLSLNEKLNRGGHFTIKAKVK